MAKHIDDTSQSNGTSTTEKFENFKDALIKKGIEIDALRKNSLFAGKSNLFSADNKNDKNDLCEDHLKQVFGRGMGC